MRKSFEQFSLLCSDGDGGESLQSQWEWSVKSSVLYSVKSLRRMGVGLYPSPKSYSVIAFIFYLSDLDFLINCSH